MKIKSVLCDRGLVVNDSCCRDSLSCHEYFYATNVNPHQQCSAVETQVEKIRERKSTWIMEIEWSLEDNELNERTIKGIILRDDWWRRQLHSRWCTRNIIKKNCTTKSCLNRQCGVNTLLHTRHTHTINCLFLFCFCFWLTKHNQHTDGRFENKNGSANKNKVSLFFFVKKPVSLCGTNATGRSTPVDWWTVQVHPPFL